MKEAPYLDLRTKTEFDDKWTQIFKQWLSKFKESGENQAFCVINFQSEDKFTTWLNKSEIKYVYVGTISEWQVISQVPKIIPANGLVFQFEL